MTRHKSAHFSVWCFLSCTRWSALDEGKEVRVVFCDISKVFDRVWHKGLIRELEVAGITGTVLQWFTDYLKDMGRSSWSQIKLEVYKRRGTTRIHIGPYSFSDIYKWHRLRDTSKHLGTFFSNDCSCHSHIDYIKEKAWKRTNIIRKLKFVLDWKALETIYVSFIRQILEYGDTMWDNCTPYEKREIDKIQHEAARIVTGATPLVSLQALYNDVRWESLQERRRKHIFIFF